MNIYDCLAFGSLIFGTVATVAIYFGCRFKGEASKDHVQIEVNADQTSTDGPA